MECLTTHHQTLMTLNYLKSGAFCAFNRQVHSLQIPKGNSIHLNYDSKSPLHRWAASDRLRLIHFLQEIQLDRALDVLPDNCTYEDLLKCPLEELRNVFSGCLTELEVNSLYSHLHSCTSIGKHETESRSHPEDSHVRRCSETRPVHQERPGTTCAQNRPRTSLGSLSCASAESSSIFMGDKPLDNTNSIISGGNECNCDCDLSKSDLVQHSTSVKRASSLGSDYVSQILPNYRPSSLSISSALTDSHSLSLQEDANTNSITGPVPCLAQADLSTSEVWKNSQSPRSICDVQTKHCSITCPISPTSCKAPKQQTNTSTYSEASSVSYVIPSFYRHGSNEPQLSPYFSSHLSNYERHSMSSTLLRIKGSFIGQSAPNLLYYMRDPNYNEFLNCRNSYLHISSAYTPPSSLKSPSLPINSNAPVLHATESPKGEEVDSHSGKISRGKSSLASNSMDIRDTVETTSTLTSLPFHNQRRSMLVSGLGSLSGSSSCMADRSMSSPAPSNEPESPFFSAASLSHNDMTYFLSPKSSFVPCEPNLNKSSDHSGNTVSQTEISSIHYDAGQQQDKGVAQPVVSQTNCKPNTNTVTSQRSYDISFNEKRNFAPRLHLGNKHTVDCRRWSLASLPSSGYGTNASESGSHLSRSRCSSRENVSHIPPAQINTQHPISRATSVFRKYQTSSQMASTKCLPIERSYSMRSPSIPVSSHFPNSISPLSFSSSVGQNEASPGIYGTSRSPKDSYTSETGNDNSPLNVSSPLYTSVCGIDSKSVPITPITRTSPRIIHGFNSGIQVCMSSSFGSCRTRSRSLSPLRVTNVGGEQDILLLNHVYRERFPKASAHMQKQLASLADEMENMDTVSWSAVARFVHCQVVQHARDCLQKALSGLVTCRYFYEMTENLGKLIEDTRARDADSIPLVVTFVRRLLLIIARPARLLECLEFDPSEFYQLLEVAENHVRRRTHSVSLPGSQIVSADVPLYIISKLGLSKTVLDESHNIGNSRLCRSDIDGTSQSEGMKSDFTTRNRTTSGSNLDNCVNDENDIVSRTARSSSSYAPIRPPCEADFEVIKLISNGAYGAVYLVRHKITRQRFSLKKIRKQHLQLRNQVEQVFAERDIMSFADNPFVVSLCCTFETKKCLCMVMEYVEGGDVATLLKHIGGPLPLDLARMYFAETVLALEYLHNYGIVHRDLKPDNLLITHEGHIKLTDFGLSRIGLMNLATNLYEKNLDLEKDCKMFRDKQVFGTPEYIAPEVILRQGYGKPVDWWSMGIMLYEFLVGCVPFCGSTIEELFDNIVTAPIDWPEEEEWKVTPSAVDIITKLLERDPLLRLGTIGGSSEVKETPFFSGPSAVDWNNLLRQKAAFVPQLEHDEDTSYFDPRTDRYQHDVENDEDIYIPMDYSSHSNRSSPAPQMSVTRNFSFNSPTDQSLTSVIRRPAASRLGRAKQQAIEHKRSHSLGDNNTLYLQPFKSRSKSRSIRDSPINTPQSFTHSELSSASSQRSLCHQKYEPEKVEHDPVTSTLTAESVAGRNALHMLQNLSLTSSTTENSSSPKLESGSANHQQTVLSGVKLEKLNIDVTKRGFSDDDVDDTQNVGDESRTFHYFSSYSPRFSVVLEQARLNELLQNNLNMTLNDSDHPNNEKSPLHNSPPRLHLTPHNDSNVKHSSLATSKDVCLPPTDEQLSNSNKRDNLSSDEQKSGSKNISQSSDAQPCDTQDGSVYLNNDHSPSNVVGSNVAIPTITHPTTETKAFVHPSRLKESNECPTTSDVDENSKLSESDSNSSLELSPHDSLIHVTDKPSDENESNATMCMDTVNISPELNQNPLVKPLIPPVREHMTGNTSLYSAKSISNSSSSTSSLSLTTVTPHIIPHTDSLYSTLTDHDSTSHKSPWFLNVDLKPENDHLSTHQILRSMTRADCHHGTQNTSMSFKNASPVPFQGVVPYSSHLNASFPYSLSSAEQQQPQLLLVGDNSSRNTYLPNPPVCSNTPLTRPLLSYSPGIPRQTIVIHKGKQGYGFVFRAIRVFFGRSDAYTLHHLVLGVVPHGPAAKAGLKEADLILSINDVSTIGMYHTDVVKLILQSGNTLRLHATPISQTFIRSDGPYRSSGRLVPRASPTDQLLNNNNNSTACTTKYSSHYADKQISAPYGPCSTFKSSHSNSPEVHNDNTSTPFDMKSYASVCASNNPKQNDEAAKRITRRLTVREARHRHLNSGNLEPKVHCLQPDTNLNSCFNQSDTVPINIPTDRSKSGYSQSVASPKSSTQTYASIAAQRFGITLGPICTNQVSCNQTAQNNNSFLPPHRRSLEKPLIRQLSERQHRAMFPTTDDTSSSSNNPPPLYTQRSVIPYSSPHQSPRSDYQQQNNAFTYHRPSLTVTSSSSGSSVCSSGWYSGGELSPHSSPGSGSPSVSGVSRPCDSNHPPSNPFQQPRFGSLRAPSHSAAQFVSSHGDNSPFKLTFTCQPMPKSAFIAQNRNTPQCRHSDPLRPVAVS
ncbi:unnamed protein product [Trichobilharzia szidati]|nr:unnamed protein product [Trichobilharzia szidati]